MISPFRVLRPRALVEALMALQEHGDDAALYAGATELSIAMKMGLAAPRVLVDVKSIRELSDVMIDDDVARVGAATTHRYIERDAELAQVLPTLVEMERQIANPRIRTRGTLGGNLVFGEPHSDPATLLTALDAEYVLQGAKSGTRTVNAADFLLGPFEAAIAPGEILTEIKIPLRPYSRAVAYQRHVLIERPAVNVAVAVNVVDGVIDDMRICVGSCGPVPQLTSAAAALRGDGIDVDLRRTRQVAEDVACDVAIERGPHADYLRNLVAVLTRRAIVSALSRCRDLPLQPATDRRASSVIGDLRARLGRWRSPVGG